MSEGIRYGTAEAIASRIEIQKSLGMKGVFWDNHAAARDVMDEAMSGENQLFDPLSDLVRDTLLTHSRQDIAHALLNTGSLLADVAVLSKRVKWLSTMAVLSVLANGVILAILLSKS